MVASRSREGVTRITSKNLTPKNSEVDNRPGDVAVKALTEPQSAESRAVKIIREVFESGRPLTYIRSAEEQRVGNVLREAGRGLAGLASGPVFTWRLTSGMHGDKDAAQSGTR